MRYGHDLFLTANGVVLLYDDLDLCFFRIVYEYPYLGLGAFVKTIPHSLPHEVQNGHWRKSMSPLRKYSEYLSPDEMSEYLDTDGKLVEYRIPRHIVKKRRQTAWEFMGNEVPPKYLTCIFNLFEGTVETSSGSAPAEEFDVEAEFSTRNNVEIQAVKILSESPWHLWQAGILTLRTIDGQKVINQHEESVVVIREFWKMSASQQKTLMSEGVTRHVWERCPLSGHSVFFMTRAWEIGRMTAYVKNYADIEEKIAFQNELKQNTEFGWLRDIPEPKKPQVDSPEAHEKYLVEQEEFLKDHGELRMFQLFAEAVEDLYTGMIDKFVRNTPALWEEFVMRLPSGEYYLVDPNPDAPTPSEATAENICLDIHNNVKFSPRLCLWAIDQKLESVGEVLAPGQFAEFCHKELKEYVDNRAEVDDSLYKHLVINTQSGTFEDPNYVNTIGSKVVIKPVGEMFELSVKKNQTLQRTMIVPQPGQSSPSKDVSGDLPPGEMPSWQELGVGWYDLPNGTPLCMSYARHFVDVTRNVLLHEWPYRTTIAWHEVEGWQLLELCEKVFYVKEPAKPIAGGFKKLLTIMSKIVTSAENLGIVVHASQSRSSGPSSSSVPSRFELFESENAAPPPERLMAEGAQASSLSDRPGTVDLPASLAVQTDDGHGATNGITIAGVTVYPNSAISVLRAACHYLEVSQSGSKSKLWQRILATLDKRKYAAEIEAASSAKLETVRDRIMIHTAKPPEDEEEI